MVHILSAGRICPASGLDISLLNFWAIRWMQYDIDGSAELVYTTYYNDRDGWYFILPESWEGKITVSRSDVAGGERAVIFSHWEADSDESPQAFLAIYALSGDNRYMRANLTGRFRLTPAGAGDDVIYAAHTAGEFVRLCLRALEEPEGWPAQRRREHGAAAAWSNRARQVVQILSANGLY